MGEHRPVVPALTGPQVERAGGRPVCLVRDGERSTPRGRAPSGEQLSISVDHRCPLAHASVIQGGLESRPTQRITGAQYRRGLGRRLHSLHRSAREPVLHRRSHGVHSVFRTPRTNLSNCRGAHRSPLLDVEVGSPSAARAGGFCRHRRVNQRARGRVEPGQGPHRGEGPAKLRPVDPRSGEMSSGEVLLDGTDRQHGGSDSGAR